MEDLVQYHIKPIAEAIAALSFFLHL